MNKSAQWSKLKSGGASNGEPVPADGAPMGNILIVKTG